MNLKRVRNIPLRVEGGVQVMSSRTSLSDPDTLEDTITRSVMGIGAEWVRERRESELFSPPLVSPIRNTEECSGC